MSHAQPNQTHDREHDDCHPALTPLVIDLIPDQTRAELEAVIDESLAVDRDWVRQEESHCFMGGRVSAGKTFATTTELLADSCEDSESGSDAANDRRES